MSSIRATKLAMGHNLTPPSDTPRCRACEASSEQPRLGVPGGTGWWCAIGQYWTHPGATCDAHREARK